MLLLNPEVACEDASMEELLALPQLSLARGDADAHTTLSRGHEVGDIHLDQLL